MFRIPICEWKSLLSNWSIGTKSRTVLFRVSICKWDLLFPNWQFRTFFCGFLSVNGTYCFQSGYLRTDIGSFCYAFLFCSQVILFFFFLRQTTGCSQTYLGEPGCIPQSWRLQNGDESREVRERVPLLSDPWLWFRFNRDRLGQMHTKGKMTKKCLNPSMTSFFVFMRISFTCL